MENFVNHYCYRCGYKTLHERNPKNGNLHCRSCSASPHKVYEKNLSKWFWILPVIMLIIIIISMMLFSCILS